MTRCRRWIGAALVIALASGGAVLAEEAPKFRFAPLNGTTQVETVKSTQTLDFGKGRTQTRTTEAQRRLVYTEEAAGRVVTATLLSTRALTGDKAQAEAAASPLKGAPLQYHIDASGKMQSVSGLDRVLEAMKKTLPPEAVTALAKTLTPEGLLKTEKADWDAATADFVGRSAKVGEAWVTEEEFLLLDGSSFRHYAAKKVTGRVRVQGKQCLRVALAYTTDPAELKPFLGDAAPALLAGLKPLADRAKILGEGQRVIDPATLICYEGHTRQWVRADVTMPGIGVVPVTFSQVKEFHSAVAPPAAKS